MRIRRGLAAVTGDESCDALLVDLVSKRIREAGALKDVREIELPPRDRFPVPEGQCEFVPMKPEEAERYRREHDEHDDHGDHHHYQ